MQSICSIRIQNKLHDKNKDLPFAARVLITDKVLTVLVDEVVCEMHAHIILT